VVRRVEEFSVAVSVRPLENMLDIDGMAGRFAVLVACNLLLQLRLCPGPAGLTVVLSSIPAGSRRGRRLNLLCRPYG